ncbi:MAG: helix-turn-helix domain-containing protein [Beijerinckiaceae bacterium]
MQKLRQECGAWVRSLREAAGLSQRDIAARVGLDYYSFVSQIESGKGRIPTAQIRAWATALNVAPRAFATELMRFYDPVNHELLFGEADQAPTAADVSGTALDERIARLEKLLLK